MSGRVRARALHREPSGLSLQGVGDASQCRARLRTVGLQPRIHLAQPGDFPAEFVDEGKALAQVGHATSSVWLPAPAERPLPHHEAEDRAEEETDRGLPEPGHGIDGGLLVLKESESEFAHPFQGQDNIGDLMFRLATERRDEHDLIGCSCSAAIPRAPGAIRLRPPRQDQADQHENHSEQDEHEQVDPAALAHRATPVGQR